MAFSFFPDKEVKTFVLFINDVLRACEIFKRKSRLQLEYASSISTSRLPAPATVCSAYYYRHTRAEILKKKKTLKSSMGTKLCRPFYLNSSKKKLSFVPRRPQAFEF